MLVLSFPINRKKALFFRESTIRGNDLTGVFCTSGSEREFTLEERWYANEEIQAGADRNAAATD